MQLVHADIRTIHQTRAKRGMQTQLTNFDGVRYFTRLFFGGQLHDVHDNARPLCVCCVCWCCARRRRIISRYVKVLHLYIKRYHCVYIDIHVDIDPESEEQWWGLFCVWRVFCVQDKYI